MRGIRWISVLCMFVISLPVVATAGVAWDESVGGDLSSDPSDPTVVLFSLGSNLIEATTIASTDTYDYLTFTIPMGQTLTDLRLLEFTDLTFGGDGNTAFHAIISGTTSYIPDFRNVNNFLGANHLDPIHVGINLLEDLAGAPLGGTGFTAPLGPGTYTYHVQQVDELLTGYKLDFIVEETEPASADFDADGDIDGQDFLAWQRAESPDPLSSADLQLWREQYSTVPVVGAIVVPEPATVVLFLTAVGLSSRRRSI
jgi:hypothetical protein